MEIHKVQHYFVVLVWRHGLYANSGPKKSIEEAIEWVESIVHKPYTIKSLSQLGKELARIVIDAWEGHFITIPSGIRFDYTGLTKKTQKVLESVKKILYGHVSSYGQVAEDAGFPGAARFVGNVMAKSRFPLLIPCHRVVRANAIGSYGLGGSEQKKRLIQAEKKKRIYLLVTENV
ncbi:MAG: MGMT family protein [Candidatus Ranarchaeia archaeon]